MLVAQPLIQAKRNAGKTQCQCVGRRCPGATRATQNELRVCNCASSTNKCTYGDPIMERSKYLGLLLYAAKANDPSETKVGTWELPDDGMASPRFSVMTGPSCEGRAVVQTSAVAKRYLERFCGSEHRKRAREPSSSVPSSSRATLSEAASTGRVQATGTHPRRMASPEAIWCYLRRRPRRRRWHGCKESLGCHVTRSALPTAARARQVCSVRSPPHRASLRKCARRSCAHLRCSPRASAMRRPHRARTGGAGTPTHPALRRRPRRAPPCRRPSR